MTSTLTFLPALNSSLRPKMRGELSASSSEPGVLEAPTIDGSIEGFLIAAALVALLLFLFLKRKPSKSTALEVSTDTVSKPSVEILSQNPTRISYAGNPWKEPEPFDANRAEHSHGHRVVSGSAYVTDGDTITINKTQIRLFGIDAPELDHPYGKKAKWAMVKLCKGHKVRAEITDTDHYGRTVARCYLPDGRDLSAELVKQGLAIDWPKFSDGVYKHLEIPGIRKKLWLADARQKGRMYLWEQYEYEQLHAKRRKQT